MKLCKSKIEKRSKTKWQPQCFESGKTFAPRYSEERSNLGAIISGSLIYFLGGALWDICDSLLYTRTHLKMESIRREFRPTDT